MSLSSGFPGLSRFWMPSNAAISIAANAMYPLHVGSGKRTSIRFAFGLGLYIGIRHARGCGSSTPIHLASPSCLSYSCHHQLRVSPNRARSSSSASMRIKRLYLAVRSPRHGAPVLIWPALVATVKSARKVSSVSPERCEAITR